MTEMSWVNELLKLAPTILLIAGYVWFTRKTLGGLGGMGGPGSSRGGMGGLFSVGKAPVRSVLLALSTAEWRPYACQEVCCIYLLARPVGEHISLEHLLLGAWRSKSSHS